MALNRERASEAVAGMGRRVSLEKDDAALAIVQLANENMANALRLLTVERGIDPREFDLVAFGGAGPLHAVALAEAVGIGRVIVPPHAGLASALGTLLADLRVDRSWTHAYRSNDLDVVRINARFDELTEAARAGPARRGVYRHANDCALDQHAVPGAELRAGRSGAARPDWGGEHRCRDAALSPAARGLLRLQHRRRDHGADPLQRERDRRDARRDAPALAGPDGWRRRQPVRGHSGRYSSRSPAWSTARSTGARTWRPARG